MASKKILLKYFFFFFFLSFLILNWNKISWIFYPNYLLRVFSFYLFEKPKIEKESKTKTENFAEKED